ncbi:monovalent cation/H+ antiporter subunit A [Actinomadura sp. NBRC 104412]|uniref:Na+/H+ antiporter subunit A n=1 Tax=Actinomadura sp. NBRC 104412 TaxID=3032203 RepID=UPI0024A45816|nr:Na+/H+ antiporter subunit A [Actinomadura sp. NBRC 104412]GLZ02709.1 monovalent cation/H+ antiporter subunit A [Actinomadura sp. NBRC 104412]
MSAWLPSLVLAHAVAALAVPWALGRHRRAMTLAAAVVPAVTAVWAATRAGTVRDGQEITARFAWAPVLGLDAEFRLDALALVMLLLVGGVGALVLVYSAWYFAPRPSRLMIGSLVAFAGAMTGLVLADNLFVLYVFWELTTVSSFILIGAPGPERGENRRAATQALLVTTAFGLVMLLGFIVLGQAAGTYRISSLLADPPRGSAATAGLVLVLLGAFAKSAQVPLHSWLPAAMVAPTPVSAYLHAAAMVKAGVYLVARLAPAFAGAGVFRPLVIAVGLASLLIGGVVALRRDDLKRLLAYGTVSQLGMLMVLFGAGTRAAALAGGALLLAHGVFKAPLFMATGVVEHELGTRRAGELSGAGRRMPVLAVAAAAATASMIGLPPFLGFVAKETAFTAFSGDALAVLAGLVAGSVLTVAYGVRFLLAAFGGATTDTADTAERRGSSAGLVGPVVVLSCAGFGLGLFSGQVGRIVEPYAGSLKTLHPGYELAVWHGPGLPLALSALALASGLGLFLTLGRAFPGRALPSWAPTAQSGYDAVYRAVSFTARAVTGRVQAGSLPAYLKVIGWTVLAVPGVALVDGLIRGTEPWEAGRLRLWDHPGQPVLVVIVIGGALATQRVRRRLSAALLLAGIGYAIGGLFVLHGAPDLALTLLVVETLTLIMLVLALRRLPERFPPRRRRRLDRLAAAVLSGCLGAFVSLFLVVAALSRDGRPSGPEYAVPAADEGAKNVVNVILVQFRALDTLGEITVLAVASLGVGGLVLTGARIRGHLDGTSPPNATGRSGGPAGEPDAGGAGSMVGPRTRWLATSGSPPLGGRSVLLEATARLLCPAILVFSAFLLFAGHGQPGGGFVGGLVAGMAFVLRYLSGGRHELAVADPVRSGLVIGTGLAMAVASGAIGWAHGGEFLHGEVLRLTVPVVGGVEASTALMFDVGIAILVLGLVLRLLSTLGTGLESRSGEPAGGPPQGGGP